ncbi:VOC family protein [Lewinella sp. IMCC34183]|uniref:VOC family protein n=1 Tax=Lewinella sp. IMCC34183 TaxID=2248762 RepID=UPI0013006709|nr:VOC family protein [Lewinella sp. IMCC34183]
MERLAEGEGVYVYFECPDLDERVVRLQEAGVIFDEPASDRNWGWREARLRDPDGNRLILYFAGAMRFHPPWRVG